jgi:hypothetical protein
MTASQAERTTQAQQEIIRYYEAQVATFKSCAEWNLSNIAQHMEYSHSAQTLQAIISEATQALLMMSKAEALEEIIRTTSGLVRAQSGPNQ